jgi:hypothetical protein
MEKQESKNRFPTFPQPRRLRSTFSYGIRILGASSVNQIHCLNIETLDGEKGSSGRQCRATRAAPKKRVISAEARRKMAEAAKKRWAAKKAAEEKAK